MTTSRHWKRSVIENECNENPVVQWIRPGSSTATICIDCLHPAITGSALALHCCKAHAKINRKIENSTPCKIVTHKDFNLKPGTRNYVADITHHATLGSNRPSRGFPPNRGNITPLWLFCYTVFFSVTRAGRTVALIVTLNNSNDVFPPKEVPFGGQDDGWRHMGKIFPKNSPKTALMGSFKPQRQNL